ncbi:MAG: hypothetical protein AAB657_05020 [Patescibacteria group bacterium]
MLKDEKVEILQLGEIEITRVSTIEEMGNINPILLSASQVGSENNILSDFLDNDEEWN